MELLTGARSGFGSKQARRDVQDTTQIRALALQIVGLIPQPVPAANANYKVTERDVRRVINLRRSRDAFFEAELFADPAWDILLELFAAELGQRRLSVGDVCVGAAVPATTALRWIRDLERKQLISRHRDIFDRRRAYLSLQGPTVDAMNRYFESTSSKVLPS